MPGPLTILVFDSGLGGLTVFREVVKARPDARYVYIADDAGFPYGDMPEEVLITRVLHVIGKAIADHKPDLIVVACNTASTLALKELRARYRVPFVGTVPAIKPACAHSQSKRVAVLGTQGTVHREYTMALIREFAAGCDVVLVGSPRLAGFAEGELAGRPASDAEIAAEIAPCFVDEDSRRTDTVVLACTHYPLLTARFKANAPWPVEWLDPAPAIARRVADLLHERPAASGPRLPPQIAFTSGRRPAGRLAMALSDYGFPAMAPDPGQFDSRASAS
jgi:glutamate racemase